MTPTYKLRIHQKVEKQLQRIPKSQQERVVDTMRSLRYDPRPSGCVKLEEQLYRVRQGQYRIIYAVFDDEVVVVICKVARRSEDTYKNIQTLLKRAENVLINED
ncbi:MAG: type II toxin-antitoxin system RelE/ParE family toxin [Candidatus Scalindua sp.]